MQCLRPCKNNHATTCHSLNADQTHTEATSKNVVCNGQSCAMGHRVIAQDATREDIHLSTAIPVQVVHCVTGTVCSMSPALTHGAAITLRFSDLSHACPALTPLPSARVFARRCTGCSSSAASLRWAFFQLSSLHRCAGRSFSFHPCIAALGALHSHG